MFATAERELLGVANTHRSDVQGEVQERQQRSETDSAKRVCFVPEVAAKTANEPAANMAGGDCMGWSADGCGCSPAMRELSSCS